MIFILNPNTSFSSPFSTFKTNIDYRFFSQDSGKDWQIKVGIYCMMMILAIICLANIMTIVAVFKKRYLRTMTNILITNLAFADLMIGLTNPFYGAPSVFKFFNTVWSCAIVTSLVTWMFGCSLFTLAAIAVERYVTTICAAK